MITVPQPTVEKPLTWLDYAVALGAALSVDDVVRFCEKVPEAVLIDERFTKAMARQLRMIRDARAAA